MEECYFVKVKRKRKVIGPLSYGGVVRRYEKGEVFDDDLVSKNKVRWITISALIATKGKSPGQTHRRGSHAGESNKPIFIAFSVIAFLIILLVVVSLMILNDDAVDNKPSEQVANIIVKKNKKVVAVKPSIEQELKKSFERHSGYLDGTKGKAGIENELPLKPIKNKYDQSTTKPAFKLNRALDAGAKDMPKDTSGFYPPKGKPLSLDYQLEENWDHLFWHPVFFVGVIEKNRIRTFFVELAELERSKSEVRLDDYKRRLIQISNKHANIISRRARLYSSAISMKMTAADKELMKDVKRLREISKYIFKNKSKISAFGFISHFNKCVVCQKNEILKGSVVCSERCLGLWQNRCHSCKKEKVQLFTLQGFQLCSSKCGQHFLPPCPTCKRNFNLFKGSVKLNSRYYCSRRCAKKSNAVCYRCKKHRLNVCKRGGKTFCLSCIGSELCRVCFAPQDLYDESFGAGLCNACKKNGVQTKEILLKMAEEVRSDLKNILGIHTNTEIEFKLAGHKEILRIYGGVRKNINGLCVSQTVNGEVTCTIYMLKYLSKRDFKRTMAHELTHNIVYKLFREQAGTLASEGFPGYVECLYARHLNFESAIDDLESWDDIRYGEGFRYIRQMDKGNGLADIIKVFQKQKIEGLPDHSKILAEAKRQENEEAKN